MKAPRAPEAGPHRSGPVKGPVSPRLPGPARPPGPWARPDLRQRAALFLLGFLGGLALGVAALAGRLDRLSLDRERLIVKTADLEIQVERLREELDEALASRPRPVVGGVSLVLQGLDEVTRVRVHAQALGLVKDLVGRPVEELDPALAFRLLDGRTVTVEGKTIRLRVRAVALGLEAVFWVDLEAVSEGEGPR